MSSAVPLALWSSVCAFLRCREFCHSFRPVCVIWSKVRPTWDRYNNTNVYEVRLFLDEKGRNEYVRRSQLEQTMFAQYMQPRALREVICQYSLINLSNCDNLCVVKLFRPHSDFTLEALVPSRATLRELSIREAYANVMVHCIVHLQYLTRLELAVCGLCTNDLRSIGHLFGLTDLCLSSNPKIDDQGMVYLENLSKLETLNVEWTGVNVHCGIREKLGLATFIVPMAKGKRPITLLKFTSLQ